MGSSRVAAMVATMVAATVVPCKVGAAPFIIVLSLVDRCGPTP